MINYFQAKLVGGNCILSVQKSELLSIMQAHQLLTPTFHHTVYQESCAALLRLDSGGYSLAAVQQMQAAAWLTLCNMPGIATTPSPLA